MKQGYLMIARLLRSCFILVCFSATMPTCLPAQSKGDIVNKIDQAVEDREAHLAGYTVTETYEMYKPGDDRPLGQRTVKTTYVRGQGKTYVEQTRRGSFQFVFDHVLRGEQKLSKAENRRAALLISDNYSVELLDEGRAPAPKYICTVNRPEAKTLVLAIKPRHSGPELVEGFLWVDAKTYHIVRIEGKLTAAPSFWVGRPTIERDYYTETTGFAMASSSCSVADTWFTGKKTLQITYKDYQFLP